MSKYCVGLILLIALAIARIVPTYRVFNSTSDEPAHISCGMEWLQWGTYTYEYQHPPLARIATAVGPFLKGLRSSMKWNMTLSTADQGDIVIFKDGNEILYSDGNYWTNLTLARLGTLPFLVLACIVTYLWGSRWFGKSAGLWAVLLLVSLPPILGHAGLATLDMACAATTVAALYQFVRWLETPEWRRCIWLAVAVGVAFLTKLSSVAFLASGFTIGIAYVLLAKPIGKFQWSLRLRQAALTAGILFLVLWAGYRFTVKPLQAEYGPHPKVERILEGKPILQKTWNLAMTTPLPLTELVLGVRDLNRHNGLGHDSYLLGEWRTSGWWYFFPVVLAVKTPIGFLLLAGIGLVAMAWRFRSGHVAATPWQHVLTALFATAILLVCMQSQINMGVRHILSIYPLLALIAGHSVSTLVEWRKSRALAVLAIALVGWVVIDSWRAHPDYLANFNEFAGSHPEKILVESDLDWGQDLDRLSRRLRQLNADHVSIAYFGSAPLDKAGLPPYKVLGLEDPVPGYLAVSVRFLNLEYQKNGGFSWLKGNPPLERIGKSIDLFWIQ